MAALPSGVLDTTVLSGTITLDFNVRLRAVEGAGTLFIDPTSAFPGNGIVMLPASGATDLGCSIGTGIIASNNMELMLRLDGVNTVLGAATNADCASISWSPSITMRRVITGMRLGVRYTLNTLVWEWYWDNATTVADSVISALAGTIPLRAGTGPTTPELIGIGQLTQMQWSADSTATGAASPVVEFSGFVANAAPLAHALYQLAGGITAAKWFGMPWAYTVDIDAVGPDGGSVPGGAAGDATYNGNRTFPSNFTQSIEQFYEDFVEIGSDQSLARAVGNAILADQWRNGQTPVPPDNETSFIFEGNTPLNPAAGARADFNCGTVRILDPLDVLLSANAFVATGAVVVSGATNTPTFTVSGAGASVTKTFVSYWRNWNDPLDGRYQAADNYTVTNRTTYNNVPAQDVWGWSLYAYLDVRFLQAVAGEVVFTITWSSITAENDIVTFEREYTKTLAGGAETIRIDLLFSDDIYKPFFGERVDSVKISEFETGTYELSYMRLRTDQDAYLRYGSRTHGDWGGVVLSQDGQMCTAHWDDDNETTGTDLDLDGYNDREKDHQNGLFAYGVDEAALQTITSYGGAFGYSAEFITDVFTDMNKMEGLTATYSDTALAAALTDAVWGRTITDRPNEWLQPNLPHTRVAANTNVNLQARILCANVYVPAGLAAGNMRVFQRQRLGLVLEAQTRSEAGVRGGNGLTVTARYFATGATRGMDPSLGTGTTDAGGFVYVPIRNGRVSGSDINVYLE